MRSAAGVAPTDRGARRPAGLFVVDDRQRIVEWSDAAAAITGLPAGRVLGQPCYEVVRGRDASGGVVCRRGCPAFEALREGRLSGCCSLVAERAPGLPSALRCELLALPGPPGGALARLHDCGAGPAGTAGPGRGGVRAGAPRDVVRDLSALAALATSLSASPIERSLDPALAVVREATGAESAEVFLADPGRREMLLAAYGGPFRSAFFQILRFGFGEGFPGLVLERRAPIVTEALDRDARYLRTRVKERGFRSYVCAPLVGPRGVVGTLSVASRQGGVDVGGVLRVLTWASPLIGAALEAGLLRLREALSAEALEAGDQELGLERLLRATLEQAIEIGGADGGGLLLVDPQAGGPVRFVTAGRVPSAVCPGLRPDAAPACPALATGLGVALHGARRSWPVPCQYAPRAGVARSCLPMLVGGRGIGVIQLAYCRRAPSPPTRSLGLLLGMADGAAPILERVRTLVERRLRARALVRRQPGAAAGAPAQGAPPQAAGRLEAEPALSVRCLGPLEIRRQGVLVTPDLFPRRKALALLKILLVHAGRPVPRDTLVERLWPGIDPGVAAGRLHVVVHALRQVVEPPERGRRWVFIRSDADAYAFDTRGPCRLDVEEFRASVALGRRAEEAGALDAAVCAYDEAVRLYRGDLLEDDPSAEWCELEREHLRESFLGVLKRLASLAARTGDLERAIEHYRRALRVDPLREELHQRLIEGLWRAGRRDEAVRQYRVCRDRLRQELGLAPLPETERLVERVRSGPAR